MLNISVQNLYKGWSIAGTTIMCYCLLTCSLSVVFCVYDVVECLFLMCIFFLFPLEHVASFEYHFVLIVEKKSSTVFSASSFVSRDRRSLAEWDCLWSRSWASCFANRELLHPILQLVWRSRNFRGDLV